MSVMPSRLNEGSTAQPIDNMGAIREKVVCNEFTLEFRAREEHTAMLSAKISHPQVFVFDSVPSSIYGVHCFGSTEVIISASLSHTPGNESAVRLELGRAVGDPTN